MTARCYFEEDVSMNREFAVEIHSCPDDPTWLVFLPPTGQQGEDPRGDVIASCGDHLLTIQEESLGAEAVQISTLPMRCASCGDPVWAAHAHDHEIVQADDCQWCKGLADRRAAKGIDIPTATEHAACSCPEEAAYLRVMEGIES